MMEVMSSCWTVKYFRVTLWSSSDEHGIVGAEVYSVYIYI